MQNKSKFKRGGRAVTTRLVDFNVKMPGIIPPKTNNTNKMEMTNGKKFWRTSLEDKT